MPSMKSLLSGIAASIVVSLAPGLAKAGVPVPALTTFDFTGKCTDCQGTAHAEFTVQDYQLGTPFAPPEFVSFHYDGTNLLPAFTITPSQLSLFSGSIGPNLPGEFDVTISSAEGLQTLTNGNWRAGFAGDFGTQGTWSAAVPEPASLALLAVGLAGLGMALRLRRA